MAAAISRQRGDEASRQIRTSEFARAVMHGFLAGLPDRDEWPAGRHGARHFFAAVQFANEHSDELERAQRAGAFYFQARGRASPLARWAARAYEGGWLPRSAAMTSREPGANSP